MKKTLLVMMIASLTSLVGCRGDGLTKIRLAEVTHSVFYAPQYVAINKGFFADEGLKVSLTNAGGANNVMTLLLSKEADIGLMGAEASVYVKNNGETNHAVNFAQLTQRDGSFIVARGNPSSFSFADLKGKTILGGRVGGMPEMVLEYILKSQGIKVERNATTVAADTVNINTVIEFNAMASQFSVAKVGDYVSLFEPAASNVIKSGDYKIVASLGQTSGEVPYTSYSTTKKYMEKNSEIIEKFTRAIYRGLQFVLENSSKEVATVIKSHFTEMSDEELETCVENYRNIEAWTSDLLLKETAFNKLLEIIGLAGELKATPKFTDLVNNSFATKIVNEK